MLGYNDEKDSPLLASARGGRRTLVIPALVVSGFLGSALVLFGRAWGVASAPVPEQQVEVSTPRFEQPDFSDAVQQAVEQRLGGATELIEIAFAQESSWGRGKW